MKMFITVKYPDQPGEVVETDLDVAEAIYLRKEYEMAMPGASVRIEVERPKVDTE